MQKSVFVFQPAHRVSKSQSHDKHAVDIEASQPIKPRVLSGRFMMLNSSSFIVLSNSDRVTCNTVNIVELHQIKKCVIVFCFSLVLKEILSTTVNILTEIVFDSKN